MSTLQTSPDTSQVILVILLIILIVYYIIDMRRGAVKKREYVTRTLLVCPACGYRAETDFQLGDYIGLKKGKCLQCGGEMVVEGIYAVEKKKA